MSRWAARGGVSPPPLWVASHAVAGLADAIRADPFAPFLTTKPDGVGLGLPICRTIVENHGGRLWVEHSSPAGTTFCFTLPALAG